MLALLDQDSAGHYKPADAAENPKRYGLVFLTGDPVGYRIDLYNDGTHYYWYHNGTIRLPDEIGAYLDA